MPTKRKGKRTSPSKGKGLKIDRMYTAQVIPKRIGMGIFDKLVGMVGGIAGLASKNKTMLQRANKDFEKGVGSGKRKGGFSFHVPFFGSGVKKRKSRKKA